MIQIKVVVLVKIHHSNSTNFLRETDSFQEIRR